MNWGKCSHIYGLRQYRDGEKALIALALAGKISSEFKRFLEIGQIAKNNPHRSPSKSSNNNQIT
jgi:hypothetical protein